MLGERPRGGAHRLHRGAAVTRPDPGRGGAVGLADEVRRPVADVLDDLPRRVLGQQVAPRVERDAHPRERGRVDAAERRAADVDAVLAQLGPQAFREVDVEHLHGGVDDDVRRAGQACPGPDQDDAAASAVAHRRGEVVHERQRADARQLDLAERIRERILEERPGAVRRSGVVDDQPDLESRGRGRHPLAGPRIGEVQRERAGLDAVAFADPGGHLTKQRLVTGDQDEVEPAGSGLLRDGRADALRGPGDQGPLAVLPAELVTQH